MRILAVSDGVVPELQGRGLEGIASGVEAIISCGDLPFSYLEYLVTFLGVPLFYVLGNHDPLNGSTSPRGCIPLDGGIEDMGGFSLVGLSGCRWYSGGPNQRTERQMLYRSLAPSARLSFRKILKRESSAVPTIFVSHAAPLGAGDASDACHRGFETFLGLIRRHKPALWLHGHVHLYDRGKSGGSSGDDWEDMEVDSTRVVNAYGYRIIDV